MLTRSLISRHKTRVLINDGPSNFFQFVILAFGGPVVDVIELFLEEILDFPLRQNSKKVAALKATKSF